MICRNTRPGRALRAALSGPEWVRKVYVCASSAHLHLRVPLWSICGTGYALSCLGVPDWPGGVGLRTLAALPLFLVPEWSFCRAEIAGLDDCIPVRVPLVLVSARPADLVSIKRLVACGNALAFSWTPVLCLLRARPANSVLVRVGLFIRAL